MYGQDTPKDTEMTGVVCNSKCVQPTAGKNTCDLSCMDKTGNIVFVDDQGKVTKISNTEKVKDMMRKKVKMRGHMMKDKDMLEITDIAEANAG